MLALFGLLLAGCAAATAKRLSSASLRNEAVRTAAMAEQADSAPSPAADAATLYPPFTRAPPFAVTDIDGSVVTFPVPGAPLVTFAYNASDAWTQAAWTGRGAEAQVEAFLSDSLLLVNASAAVATRYLFASFAAGAGAAQDAAAMKAALGKAMTSLAWPEAQQTDWLSRATFAADPVTSIAYLGDLLANWSNVGSVHRSSLSLSSSSGEPLSVARLDSHVNWLPPVPHEPLPLVVRGSGECASPCAVLVGCGFDLLQVLGGFEVATNDDTCNYTAAVASAAELQGALFALVVQRPGVAMVEMDCASEAECASPPSLAASLVSFESGLALAHATAPGKLLTLSNEAGESGITFSVTSSGLLAETGWLGSPTLRFLSWAAHYLDYYRRTIDNITLAAHPSGRGCVGAVTLRPDGSLLAWGDAAAGTTTSDPVAAPALVVVPVFNYSVMQGYPGAVAIVTIPDASTLGGLLASNGGGANFTRLVVEAALGCETPWETSCAPWDRQMQVLICCSGNLTDPTCGGQSHELTRYITPFRRGLGHWLTDVTTLLPLMGDGSAPRQCALTMATDAWALPWTVTLALRLERDAAPAPTSAVVPLWNSGTGGNGGASWGVTFDATYNTPKNFPVRQVPIPSWATKALLHSVITGHGADNFNCAEFCVTSHAITVAGTTHTVTYDNAGTDEGCTHYAIDGALPNEHGTWLYGRDGWCDGSAIRPWLADVTGDIAWGASTSVNISYRGTYNGADPHPNPQTNMPYIIIHVYVAFS